MIIKERPIKVKSQFSLDTKIDEYLTKIADSCRTSRSGVVEDLIKYYLANEGLLVDGKIVKIKL